MKENDVKTMVVSKRDSGLTAQAYLAAKLALSRRAAKNLLDARAVWINRNCVWMAHHQVRQGDTVAISGTRQEAQATIKSRIRVLVEDEHYLVVDKPSSMITSAVESAMREQTGIRALDAVHRLDRETTGCLLLAKHAAARDAAIALFKTRKVTKIYQAIVNGVFARPDSTIKKDLDGERAVSHFRRVASSRDATLLKARIETGRTHQIRRHLAGLRHPVLGDRQYGFKQTRDPRFLDVPRHMLHAAELEMPHPLLSGQTLRAHSPMPADFRRCLKLFGMGK